MEHAPNADYKPSPKNLVICRDNIGNEISENISSALKLHRCLHKTDRAHPRPTASCDPGPARCHHP